MKKRPLLYGLVKAVATVILKTYRPKFIGKENIPTEGPIILCSNHIHAFDPGLILMATNRTVYNLAKIELFKFPLKLILNNLGTIPVDRSKKDINAVSTSQEYLQDGQVLCIFPEGTRNKSKDILLPFKYGAVSLAQKTGALIAPIAIVGKYKFFRKSLIVKIGKPIDITGMDKTEANEYLKEKLLELLIS